MVTEVSAILVASITYTHHMQKENLTEFIASEDKLPFVCFGVLYETLLAEYVYVYERERERVRVKWAAMIGERPTCSE